jgi:anti-sigma B factor antagonist
VQPFDVETVSVSGDCAVLRIGGEVDAYAAPLLRERVLNLAGGGTVLIIADMSGARFLDSAGVSALVSSRTALLARGGSLALVACTDRILQTLRITGLSGAFAVYPAVQDAIAPVLIAPPASDPAPAFFPPSGMRHAGQSRIRRRLRPRLAVPALPS